MRVPCVGQWVSAVASVAVMLAVCQAPLVAHAASAGLSYQGTLADAQGNVIPDGTYTMRFTIFTTVTEGPVGGVWQESHASVETSSGAFTVELGLSNPLGTLFTDESMLWLEIEVDQDGDGFEADEKYSPRVSLSAAPYVLSGGTYTDTDAVNAMGAKDNANPLNHDRFTDSEVSANADVAANTAFRETADVAFRAYRSSSGTLSDANYTKFPLNSELFDIGNDFDTSTGTFTAPANGVYALHLVATVSPLASDELFGLVIRVDGANRASAWGMSPTYTGTVEWQTLSISVLEQINEGSSVEVWGDSSALLRRICR